MARGLPRLIERRRCTGGCNACALAPRPSFPQHVAARARASALVRWRPLAGARATRRRRPSSLEPNDVSLFEEACRYIPGGVNSPVRAFRGVGGEPIFFARARGSHVWSADGREYIDYVGSWGPMILGHAHPDVIRAVQQTAADGLSFGAPTAIETTVARRICELVPSIELVRMVSSGTEATMSAIRLARGFTRREKIVKFEGCYHGHSDSLLVKAGSGTLTLGVPTSPGVPPELAAHTLTLAYNDSGQVRALFHELGSQIACVIVEPVAGNMNCIPPAPGFLETLREECTQTRRRADLRRGDDGFPRGAGRRARTLRDQAGPHDTRQDRGRRHAGGRVRRPPRDHAAHRSARARVPGRHAVGKPGRDGGRPRDTARHRRARLPCPARRADRPARAGRRGRRALGRRLARHQSRLRHVRAVLHGVADGHVVRRRDALRRRALQALLPRHARGRRLPRAVGVRGRIRVGRAHRGRHRRDDRRGRPRLRANRRRRYWRATPIVTGRCSGRECPVVNAVARAAFGAAGSSTLSYASSKACVTWSMWNSARSTATRARGRPCARRNATARSSTSSGVTSSIG